MRIRTFLPLAVAVFSTAAAAASFVALVPKVRAVEAVTLFATAFTAGASFAVTVQQYRQRQSKSK